MSEVPSDRPAMPYGQVAYQVALQYLQFEKAYRDFVIHWARTRLDTLQTLVKSAVVPKTDRYGQVSASIRTS